TEHGTEWENGRVGERASRSPGPDRPFALSPILPFVSSLDSNDFPGQILVAGGGTGEEMGGGVVAVGLVRRGAAERRLGHAVAQRLADILGRLFRADRRRLQRQGNLGEIVGAVYCSSLLHRG